MVGEGEEPGEDGPRRRRAKQEGESICAKCGSQFREDEDGDTTESSREMSDN